MQNPHDLYPNDFKILHHSITIDGRLESKYNGEYIKHIMNNGYKIENDILPVTDTEKLNCNTDVPYFLNANPYEIQITVIFFKWLNNIYIDPENDTDPAMLGWLDSDGILKFNQFMTDIDEWLKQPQIGTCFYQIEDKKVSLYDLIKNKDHNKSFIDKITPLYGFVVTNIKPDEVLAIQYNMVKENMLCDVFATFKKVQNSFVYIPVCNSLDQSF